MSSYLQQIKETVETPDGWTTSQTDESVACYQGIGIGPERSDLRVLVEYTTRDFESGSDNGMVETAYPPAPGTRSKIHHMKYLKGSV
ncbi:MAG TPA: hypothetical protein VN709_05600 [Terriglobales bacterium]|nr:hypothetical protein [Terriglobales bacterium]